MSRQDPSCSTLGSANAGIARVLNDPSVREPVKRYLCEALDRDPVDSAADAELIASLLSARADALLRSAVASVSG